MLFREGIDNEDYAWNSEWDGKKWVSLKPNMLLQ